MGCGLGIVFENGFEFCGLCWGFGVEIFGEGWILGLLGSWILRVFILCCFGKFFRIFFRRLVLGYLFF